MKTNNRLSQYKIVKYSRQSLIINFKGEKRLIRSLTEFRAIQLHLHFFQEGLQDKTFNRQPIPTLIL